MIATSLQKLKHSCIKLALVDACATMLLMRYWYSLHVSFENCFLCLHLRQSMLISTNQCHRSSVPYATSVTSSTTRRSGDILRDALVYGCSGSSARAGVEPATSRLLVRRSAYTRCRTDQQVWFTVDFQETFSRKFSRICSFIDICRTGSLTPGITLILFTQAIAQLKDNYRGLIAPISINPGLLQYVLLVHCEVQYRILSQPENFQETLLISSRFPGFNSRKKRLFQ